MSKKDVIIIGAGIAGLYAAYKIKYSDPTTKILVLEKNNHLGGRAGTQKFHGTAVQIGAGIGRAKKDHLLRKLLQDFHIPTHDFVSKTTYAPTISPHNECNIKQTFAHLKREYIKHNHQSATTFRHFAEHILGKSAYKHFRTCAGYTDFEKADTHDVLYDYGFDDNFGTLHGFSVPWTTLVQELAKHIGKTHIHRNEGVAKVEEMADGTFRITTDIGATYIAKKVVFATTASVVQQLIPSKKSIYRGIHGQPFLRIYGKFAKESIPIIKAAVPEQTVVPGPVHKMIPMNPDKGVYMIVYSDNIGATFLEKYTENTEENRAALCRILEKSLDLSRDTLTLSDIVSFYWEEGTHYYPPLEPLGPYKTRVSFINAVQRPSKNIYVVGEMVARDQGWVEGALESVERVLPHLILAP